MSQSPSESKTKPAPMAASIAFLDLGVATEEGAVTLTHTRERTYVPQIVLGVTTLLFTLFIIGLLPAMNLTAAANALWVIVGLAILLGVGFVTQLPARTTRLRIDRAGLQIDQGTLVDREQVLIAWNQLAGVELEPVKPTDGDAGMKLRIAMTEGEPVDLFEAVAVGDLHETRRMILQTAQRRREKAKATTPTETIG